MLPILIAFKFFKGASEVVSVSYQPAGGTSKRKRRRATVIRFSDLDERERREALAAIPVKPFTPLEAAAVALAEDHDQEAEDDEITLSVLMRILH